MFQTMKPIFTEMSEFDGNVFVSISSCEGGKQRLDNIITGEGVSLGEAIPPEYILANSEDGGVAWDNALAAWTVFLS